MWTVLQTIEGQRGSSEVQPWTLDALKVCGSHCLLGKEGIPQQKGVAMQVQKGQARQIVA